MSTATQTPVTEQQLFDVKDAAAYLESLGAKGVTVYFVRTLITSGQLDFRPIGRKFFIKKAELDKWLDRSAKKRRP